MILTRQANTPWRIVQTKAPLPACSMPEAYWAAALIAQPPGVKIVARLKLQEPQERAATPEVYARLICGGQSAA